MPVAPARGTVALFYAVRTRHALDHLLIDSGFSYRRLEQVAAPAADWYIVQAAASCPCSTGCKVMTAARDALAARALRSPVRLYALASLRSTEILPFDLPAGALYAHATMPSL